MSSLGAMFSFFAILLFFFIIFNMFFSKNLFFLLRNHTYVIFLTSYGENLFIFFSKILGKILGRNFSFNTQLSKSFYVFSKYNFFNSYDVKFIYIYLFKFL